MSLMRSEQSRKWSKSHRSPTNLLCSIFLVANTHKHLNGAISTNQGDDITSSCISFVALGALLWHHFDEVSYVVPSDAGLNQTREESGKRHRRRPGRRRATRDGGTPERAVRAEFVCLPRRASGFDSQGEYVWEMQQSDGI